MVKYPMEGYEFFMMQTSPFPKYSDRIVFLYFPAFTWYNYNIEKADPFQTSSLKARHWNAEQMP